MRTCPFKTASLVLLVALSAFGMAGCAQAVSIHTAANPAAHFEQYRTFTFAPAEGPPRGYQMPRRSPEVEQRLRALIAAALTQRGYLQGATKGDFLIMFGFGRRTIPVHEDSAVGGEWLPDDEDADFVEGSLVIDAFDSSSGARVWHGACRGQNDLAHVDDALLQRTVSHLLAPFPSTTGRGG
jgi:hypothetical protein